MAFRLLQRGPQIERARWLAAVVSRRFASHLFLDTVEILALVTRNLRRMDATMDEAGRCGVLFGLREQVWRHLQTLAPTYYARTRGGEIRSCTPGHSVVSGAVSGSARGGENTPVRTEDKVDVLPAISGGAR